MDLPALALQQHLRDAGGAAEVAVDLERGMRVEQVGVRAASRVLLLARRRHVVQVRPQHAVRVIAVEEAGPEPDLPRLAPAGAAISPEFERSPHGGREIGRVDGIDLVVGEQPDEVRHVAMLRILVVPVLVPLLEIAAAADLVRRHPVERRLHARAEVGVDPERGRGFDDVQEQAAHEGEVAGRHDRHRAHVAARGLVEVFGRGGGRRDQAAVRPFDQPVQGELRGALHQRIAGVAQPGPVSAEQVVLPGMEAQPDPSHRPVRPHRVALTEVAYRVAHRPDVGVVVGGPASGPVEVARRHRARLRDVPEEPEQRLVALGQIRRLRRPVVHLGVDVDRVVAAPRRPHVRVPDALQVERGRTRPGAADEQVAPELEVERLEAGVGCAGRVAAQADVGRGAVFGPAPEIQRHAVEERADVPLVLVPQAGERPALQRVQPGGRRWSGVGPARGLPVEPGKTRVQRDGHEGLPCAADRDRRRTALDPAIGGDHPRPRREPHPLRVGPLVVDDRVLDVTAVVRLGAHRRPARHHEVPVRRHRRRMPQLALEAKRERERARRRGLQPEDQDACGMRHEGLALEGRAPGGERGPGRCGGEVEFAPVAARRLGLEPRRVDVEVPQRRVRLRESSLQLPRQFGRGLVVALEQGFANLGQGRDGLGVHGGVDRPPGPERRVVQEVPVRRKPPEDHHSRPAVPERERLLEGRGRLVVPKQVGGSRQRRTRGRAGGGGG